MEERARRFGKGKYGRVLKMARKPTRDEFNKTCLIVGLGIILIGSLGFLIYFLWTQLPPVLRNLLGI
jgi:protein transport protein SEC61 subunit gamma-like protein